MRVSGTWSAPLRAFLALLLVLAAGAVWNADGAFFQWSTHSAMLRQASVHGILACGMTLVIVIRQIDLSVGFLAGFLGAIAAIALVSWHLPVYIVIPLVLLLGALAGCITAFPVAQLGIPSFVASLADDRPPLHGFMASLATLAVGQHLVKAVDLSRPLFVASPALAQGILVLLVGEADLTDPVRIGDGFDGSGCSGSEDQYRCR